MADFRLHKLDEYKLRIEAELSLLMEMCAAFTYKPQGYKFMPAYKYGQWDGTICLLDCKTRTISQGLLPQMIQWCRDNYCSIELADDIIHRFDNADDWLNDWEQYSGIKPYDYQLDAAKRAIKLNKVLIKSPTGSGKSLILHSILSFLMENTDYKALITVPSKQLVEQVQKDMVEYHAPMKSHLGTRVIVSTWQGVYKKDKDYFEQFDAYICDEAHMADGKSITGIVEKLCDTAKIRIGLTGTLDGSKCHEMQLRSLFGPIVETRSTKELMNDGKLTPLATTIHVLKHSKAQKMTDYQNEVKWLAECTERNHFIIEQAAEANGNILVLFNYIDHGKRLFEMAELYQDKKECYYISGETPVQEREAIRSKIAKQNNIMLFASYGTFQVGINAPNISYLMLAHPTKSQIRTLQSIGRVLRKKHGKKQAMLIDIADDLSPKRKNKNHTYRHMIERMKIYDREQFRYQIQEHDL